MFSLCLNIARLLRRGPLPPLHVMVVGLNDAGKTYYQAYLAAALARQPLDEILDLPTIGVNTKLFDYAGHAVSVWDIGGSRNFRSVWRRYLDDSDAIVYCIDASNEDALDEALAELGRIPAPDTQTPSRRPRPTRRWSSLS